MTAYGQFCPVAKAMEVLDERWTLLVLRELLSGSTRFNEIRRGVPKMSPALLAKRLRSLERSGLVRRGGAGDYRLTPAGEELFDVVQAIGLWGLRWVPELGEEDLDPHLLLWDMSRTVPTGLWPPGRTVVELTFTDTAPHQRRWWFVVADGEPDVCDLDPGFDVDVRMRTTLRTLVRIWRGERPWAVALREGMVELSGPSALRTQVPVWFGRSTLAEAVAG